MNLTGIKKRNSRVQKVSYKNGKKITPVIGIDKEKVNEDLKYAGYNLMVTSELDMEPLQIYQTYHSLWKIEESFRITKSYLDARPVYVHKKETIYGHFLICYLSLFLLRVLEIKVFKNQINSYDLIDFIRDFRVVNKGDGSYINISRNQMVNEKAKKATGLTNLDALFLSKKKSKIFFRTAFFPTPEYYVLRETTEVRYHICPDSSIGKRILKRRSFHKPFQNRKAK